MSATAEPCAVGGRRKPSAARLRAAGLALAVLIAACSGSGDGEASDSPAAVRGDTTTVASQPGSTPPETLAPGSDGAGSGSGTTTDQPPSTTVSTVSTTTVPPAPPSTLDGPRTTAEASAEDPVPVGEVVEVTGLWDISVVDVDFDAADAVLEFADINPAPDEGWRYVMITIEGVYLGERVAQPAFEWVVSDGEIDYLPAIPGCGVIPDSIYDVVEVTPGAKFHANVCVPVEEASLDRGLTLFLQPLGADPWYFQLG